jgi:hypothetical protein
MRRFNIIMFTVATLFTVARTIPGQAFFFWLLVQNGLFEAYSRETFDFVRTRPFGGAQRFVGGVLIPLLVSLVVPTLMTAIVDLDRINNVSIFGWFLKVDDPHADLLRYLRKTLGATFLPEKWPAAGLTDEMWLRVRPLVWLDLLRMTTIIVATRFAQGRVRGVGLETVSLVISIVPMFATLPGMIGGPAAPLWFTALLAAIAIALWGWCERAANRFGVATDTSSSG